MRQNNLHDADTRANIDEKIRENTRINVRETVFGIPVALVDKYFIMNVLQEEITAFNEASHFFFFVNPVVQPLWKTNFATKELI